MLRNRINFSLYFIMFCLLISCLSSFNLAYGEQYTIKSCYKNVATPEFDKIILWTFLAQSINEGRIVTITDSENNVHLTTQMYFNSNNQLVRATDEFTIRGKLKLQEQFFDSSGPAVTSNSLPPINWLNLDATANRSTTKNVLGLRTFSDNFAISKFYTISQQALSKSMALQLSMVDNTIASNLSDDLILFTVTDTNSNVIFKQLWDNYLSWWIYDESTLRKSWQIK